MQHETTIIQGVLERIKALPGVSAVTMKNLDGVMEIMVAGKKHRFEVEVKKAAWQIKPELVDHGRKNPVLWLAPVVPRNLAKKLQAEGTFYADTAGNIHIALPGFYALQETDDAPLVDLSPKRVPGALFNPTTTRVALHLLLQPKLLQTPLRQIAATSGVALRSAQLALDALLSEKCIVDLGNDGLRFHNKERLFRKFVEGYNQKLRPKLVMGLFAPVAVHEGASLELKGCDACWGGDVGAELLMHSLEPKEFLVYTYKGQNGLVLKNRLRLSPQGSISVYNACWTNQAESLPLVAPAIVVYADLIHAQDPRCDETAERLYQENIRELLNA
jgi:hypothetical protein